MIILAAFNAPLALKEPVFCRFSALKNTFLPTIESRVELVKYGVKWMYGEILSCAFLMSESAIFIRLVIFKFCSLPSFHIPLLRVMALCRKSIGIELMDNLFRFVEKQFWYFKCERKKGKLNIFIIQTL